MKFGFIVKHRGIWPTAWLCEALGVSRGGFYAWLTRRRVPAIASDEALGPRSERVSCQRQDLRRETSLARPAGRRESPAAVIGSSG